METDHLHWLDVEEIAEELNEAYPDVNPLTLRFTALRELVESLPNFREQPGHPVNERILEVIQANWIEECDDEGGEDRE